MATAIPTLPTMPSPSAYSPPPSSAHQIPIYSQPTAPSEFLPAGPTSPKSDVAPDRTVTTFRMLNRMSRVSIDALNWAERKTREAAERQLERQIARAESSGTTVVRATEDPREPKYQSRRREVRFAESAMESDIYVSGGLRKEI